MRDNVFLGARVEEGLNCLESSSVVFIVNLSSRHLWFVVTPSSANNTWKQEGRKEEGLSCILSGSSKNAWMPASRMCERFDPRPLLLLCLILCVLFLSTRAGTGVYIPYMFMKKEARQRLGKVNRSFDGSVRLSEN
jgi:hypothetical protein